MKKLILFVVLAFPLIAGAQKSAKIIWAKNNFSSELPVMRRTTDGGYIMAAGITIFVPPAVAHTDMRITKFDSAGNVLWNQTYGGSKDDFAKSVVQTSDGGYIIAGFTFSTNSPIIYNHGASDFWVLKLDALGAVQWQNTYGGTNNEQATSIIQTLDGGYMVAGWSQSVNLDVTGNHGAADAWLLKLNSIGGIQWQKSMGGTFLDQANIVLQTADSGYTVAGLANSLNGDVSGIHGGTDVWLFKVSKTGALLWQHCYGGNNSDGANDMIQTRDGGYLVAGYTSSNNGDVSGNNGGQDAWVIKLSGTGTLQWQKCLGGPDADIAHSVFETFNSKYLVTGWASRDSAWGITIETGFVTKIHPDGSTQWVKPVPWYGRCTGVAESFDLKHVVLADNPSANDWIMKIDDCVDPPAIAGSNKAGVCKNETVELNANTGAYTFSWFANGNYTNTLSNQRVFNAGTGGVYRVRVQDAYGCADTSAALVLPNYPMPVVKMKVNQQTQCFNGNSFLFTDSTTLSAGTYSRLWSMGNNVTSVQANPAASYNSSGNFTVKLFTTTNNNCMDTGEMVVTVKPSPRARFNANQYSQCLDQNQYVFRDSSAYAVKMKTRYWDFGNTQTDSAVQPLVRFSNSGKFNITLKITDENGCPDSVMQTVSVLPVPAVSLVQKGNIHACDNASYALSATVDMPVRISWHSLQTMLPEVGLSASIRNSGTYFMRAVSDSGCTAFSDSATISFIASPHATYAVDGDTIACADKPVKLKGVIINASQFSWLHNGNALPVNDSVLVPVLNGIYRLVVKDTANCADTSAAINITRHPVPAGSLFPKGLVATCSNTPMVLASSGTLPVKTEWYRDATFTGDTGSKLIPQHSGTYYTRVITDKGCTAFSDSTLLLIHQIPDASISLVGDSVACGDKPAAIISNSASADLAVWLRNGQAYASQGNFIQVTSTGIYSLVLKDTNNCADTSISVHIVRYPLPTKPVIAQSKYFLESSEAYVYEWKRNGSILPAANQRVLYPPSSGAYQVIITDSNGCSTISDPYGFAFAATLSVHPNPNNGRFFVDLESENDEDFYLTLFDAEGKKVTSMTVKMTRGINHHELIMQPGLNGLYFLEVKSVDKTEVIKLLIRKEN